MEKGAHSTVQRIAHKTSVDILRNSLNELPEPLPRPLLIVVIGLPGTGKTYFTHLLYQRFPVALLESDSMRAALFKRPSYSQKESAQLFNTCHLLIEELLSKSIPVAFDATNLIEANRRKLYDIADRTGAALILVKMKASRKVIRRRLRDRSNITKQGSHSKADWEVYKKLARSEEPIERSHYSIDTSRDVEGTLDSIVTEVNRLLGYPGLENE